MRFWAVLAGLACLALALRMWGIDLRSITHPEVYVPGIDLVPGISEPPPRHDFLTALRWHFHDEPHPMGWYLAMMGWTEVFGTSHTALRLPSALFGAGAVVLIALLGRRIWGTHAGLLAAALLCLHGLHLFWSQNARMYTAGVFLGLLSTWLLLRLLDADRKRPGLEIAYVLSIVAGVQTVELFWPVAALQVGWVALFAEQPAWRGVRRFFGHGPRLLQVQAVALMLAAPALVHALYRARGGAAADPDPMFLADQAAFGGLFAPDEFAIPGLSVPLAATLALAVLWLGLAVLGTRLPARAVPPPRSGGPALPGPLPVITALLVAALIVWMGAIAHRRSTAMMLLGVLPVMALAIPALATAGRHVLRTYLPSLDRWRGAVAPVPVLLGLYAVLAPAVLYVASYKMSVLAPRAFMVFLPYQLLLAAAGIVFVAGRVRVPGLALGVSLVAVFALSIPYSWQKPGSPRDYRGLEAAMRPEMRPDDLVFLRARDWADTPFLYYLGEARLVVENWTDAVTANPGARIWLVTWPHEEMPVIHGPRREALAGHTRVLHVRKLRAEAELFVPGDSR